MSSCTITFHNNPQGVFYGGQTLSGTAVLHTVKQKTIRAIHIEINGYAKVRWTERKSRRSGNRTVHYTETYSSHDQYLASRTYMVGREGGDSVEFAAGTHTYSFQVQLPPQIPSSFNGRHGHIRYEVVLTVDRPWRFDNVFKVPFTVISTLDLNLNPSYKMPLKQEVMKEFNCGCCGGQPLKVRCDIPFSGYAPGQKIHFTLLVQNESTVDCYGSKVKLEKTVRFTSTSPHSKSRFDTMKIVEKRLDAVPRLTNKEFKEFIQLPAIPPSSLQTCRIIEVFYMFTAVVYTSGCHRNAELTFPITIGTYPLRESATNPANVVTVQPTAPKLPENGHDAPPAYFPPHGIHIEIKGRAKVRWSEEKSRSTSDGKTEYYTVHYTGDEQYLSSRTYVAGVSGGSSIEFPAGTHTYDFQVVLPTGIPSSFEGQYGNIRYEVIVTVDRPWRFDNTFKRLFSVIEHLDLNSDPSNKVPIRREDIKTFCWGCCSDDFIKTTCHIPFSAYAPGQKVPYHIFIENSSTSSVYRTKIKLEKVVTFTVTSPETKSRKETTKILERELEAVLKLSNKDFNGFIQLPSIPPTSSQTSHIINVSYWITVKGYISGCTSDAELYFPIKIGTVPLQESATNPASIVTVQPSAPGKEDLPPAYIAQNPPSYEDALALGEQSLTDDEEDSHVKKEPFVPKYPVFYNFAAPTAPPADMSLPSAPPAFTNNASPSTSVNPEAANLLPYPTNDTGLPVPTTNDSTTTYGWKATT